MSEEQMTDTIEMLYKRLNGYNKQDLFNYGYLLESNQILCKDIEEKDKEIERLNNIINELEKELNIAYKELQPNELVNGQNLIKNIQITIIELKENYDKEVMNK